MAELQIPNAQYGLWFITLLLCFIILDFLKNIIFILKLEFWVVRNTQRVYTSAAVLRTTMHNVKCDL